MIDLSGKVALVTGASRGIGRATALRLAQAGADVVINYATSRASALEVGREIRALGRRSWAIKADVSEEEDVACMLDFVKERIGRLDILVSNAATGGFRPLLESKAKHFQAALGVNVLALIHLARESAPLLTKGPDRGKIVVLSSHGAFMALPAYGLIGGSKACVESVARHLTLELGDRGVNVNIVRAGLVATDSTKLLPGSDAMFEHRTTKTMTGQRVLQAEDVADAIMFLCSPMADMIQGETLTVDGGNAIHV